MLIVFTRWYEKDLVGRLEKQGKVYTLGPDDDIDKLIEELEDDIFIKLNFEAIKTSPPNSLDPRKIGEALFPEKHDITKLKSVQALDDSTFESLYQGRPTDKKGRLYKKFVTYGKVPPLREIKAYTDTADKGTDYLCSIIYGLPANPHDPYIYVLDIYYTQEGTEDTIPGTIARHVHYKVTHSRIESNSGGQGFGDQIEKKLKEYCEFDIFHQGDNKIGRITSKAYLVQNFLAFPEDWNVLFPEYYTHMTGFKKDVSKNKTDDCADTATGIVETECEDYALENFDRR